MAQVQTQILKKLFAHIKDDRPSEAVQDWHSLMSGAGRCNDICTDGVKPEVIKCANCLNAKLLHTCGSQSQTTPTIANDCYIASTKLMRWVNQNRL